MAEVRIGPGDGHSASTLLRVGDVLAVEVPENRTTGYVWSVDFVPGVLAELPDELPDELPAEPPADHGVDPGGGAPAGPPRPGAPGGRTLRFAAQQPGTGELRLRHARPWQPAEGDEVTISVYVEAAS